MLRFPQRVRYISLYRCFSFFASTNLGNCVFQPSAAPVLRPAPNVCIISRNFINTSDFLIYFQKELAFSDGYAILFFAENNSPLRIPSLLLFFFSSDRPEQAGIPLPTRSGLLFAFFRICHLDAAGWHPIQFNGAHYNTKGERRQCGSRQPRSLRKSCP